MISRYRIYENGLYAYGFICLCRLIEYYSDLEDYEEAALVKKVLEDISKKIDFTLPTVYNEESISLFQELVLETGGKDKPTHLMKIVIEENANKILNEIKNKKVSSAG